MNNELAVHDPNQIKNNLVVRNPSEFAKPDKTRQVNDKRVDEPGSYPLRSVVRDHGAMGSPPSVHTEGYDITRHFGY
jgi:hypothetical protein